MVAPISTPPPDTTKPFQIRNQTMADPMIIDDIYPELCPRFAEIIATVFQQSRGQRGAGSVNRGGWKSGEGLLDLNHPEIQLLAAAFAEIAGVRPVAWAMVNRAGSEHPRHNHLSAIITGVYYVTAGDPEVPTIFEVKGKPELEVYPQPGRLVISPGDMWHRVPPYPGTEEPRITIAFDVRRR